jgi:hypothetical protein
MRGPFALCNDLLFLASFNFATTHTTAGRAADRGVTQLGLNGVLYPSKAHLPCERHARMATASPRGGGPPLARRLRLDSGRGVPLGLSHTFGELAYN